MVTPGYRLGLVVVIDGLRPSSITPEGTPVLHGLAQDGAVSTRGRAVVPAVTRVNASSMATGMHPTATGITGNVLYAAEVSAAPFTTADSRNLLRLRERTGAIVEPVTLAERVEGAGGRFVAIGSGSSGSSLCLNPRAPDGVGVMVNADDPRKQTPLAFPPEIGEELVARFGPPPHKGIEETNDASVDYVTGVVTDYVLDALEPDVLMLWMTEPDSAQHRYGVGSPQARQAIRNADRNLGLLVDRLDERGLTGVTNLFVVSDHGFSRSIAGVDVAEQLVGAGLKQAPDSTDVVVATTGCASVFVEPGRDVEPIVAWLQRQDWVDALFTAGEDEASGGRSPQGWVDGTLSRALLGSAHPTRSPDILVTFPWTADGSPDDAQARYASANGTGPSPPGRSDHGALSPADLTTTFLAWGADIASVVSAVPVGNVDLAPTLLALGGDREAPSSLDGRVAEELLVGGVGPDEVDVREQSYRVECADTAYRAVLNASTVDGRRYVDLARRLGREG